MDGAIRYFYDVCDKVNQTLSDANSLSDANNNEDTNSFIHF